MWLSVFGFSSPYRCLNLSIWYYTVLHWPVSGQIQFWILNSTCKTCLDTKPILYQDQGARPASIGIPIVKITHWDRDKMAAIFQTTVNNTFSWMHFLECQSYFSNFLRVFKKIYEESFPLTRVKIRYRNRLPWLSNGLKASIKYKNKLYLISLKHPTLYNISKYKQYKNKLIFLLKNWRKAFSSKSNSTK